MSFTKVSVAGIGTTGTITFTNVNAAGVVTATSFVGDGSNITGVSGGGIGTVIKYADNTNSPFSFVDVEMTVTSNLDLNTTNAGASNSYIVAAAPNVTIASGVGVTVGTGKTMVIDVLNLGDL